MHKNCSYEKWFNYIRNKTGTTLEGKIADNTRNSVCGGTGIKYEHSSAAVVSFVDFNRADESEVNTFSSG